VPKTKHVSRLILWYKDRHRLSVRKGKGLVHELVLYTFTVNEVPVPKVLIIRQRDSLQPPGSRVHVVPNRVEPPFC